MALVIPTTIVEKIVRCVSYPFNSNSTDGFLNLVIHPNEFVIHTTEPIPKHFATLKFDDITDESLGIALARSYIYDKATEPDYRVRLEVAKSDPNDGMKSVMDYEFWVGREDGRVWIGIFLKDYGSAKFVLKEIE